MKLNRRRFLRHNGQGLIALAAAGCGTPSDRGRDITDLADADAVDQIALLAQAKVSPAELLEAAITRAEAVNPKINAIVATDYEAARERAAGQFGDMLGGVPYLIKDLSDVTGLRTSFGSRAFMDNVAQQDAPIVQALRMAGVNVFGKTNTPEFGLIATTESLALGPCRNPWNLDHSSGGSSGGAAAAVAAGIVPIAQASDGGGSIRIPAACCGLVGLKPSRGRMSGEEDNTDVTQISVRHAVSRTVRDNALFLAAAEGHAGGSSLTPVGLVQAADVRPLKIAFSTTSAKGTVPDAEVVAAQQQVASLCASLGHEVVEAAPVYDGVAFETAFLDLWSRLGWIVRERLLGAGVPEGQLDNLLEPWTLYLAEHFARIGNDGLAQVQKVFAQVQQSVSAFMQGFDVWLTPVLSSTAPRIGEHGPMVDPEVLKRRTFDYVEYTPLANALGTPAISLPLTWSADGLPIGSMFMAKYGQEKVLLQLAYQLEEAQPWRNKRAEL